MADEMSLSQALRHIRQGAQVLRFLENLETAARMMVDVESRKTGAEQALAEKQQQLAVMEVQVRTAQDQVAVELEACKAQQASARKEHEEVLAGLAGELEEKQRQCAMACANEDTHYLQQCQEHEAKLAALQATITEREGYLAGLTKRIGELRADLELIR